MSLEELFGLPPLTVAVLLTLGGYALIYLIDRGFGQVLFRPPLVSDRELDLKRQLASMETTISVLSQQLNEKLEFEKDLRDQSRRQIDEIKLLKSRIADLQTETSRLSLEIRKQSVDANQIITVLGIWPSHPEGTPALNQAGESDALYNSGLSFVELLGPAANIDGIVREMDRSTPRIIEIGAHGDILGNPILSDGPTEPGWWGHLVDGREIDLVVLLYCRSNQQDRLNVADVLIRSGVKAVISFNRPIADDQSIRFVRMLYEKIAEGQTIDQAVSRAKLVVNRSTRDTVRLRTKPRETS